MKAKPIPLKIRREVWDRSGGLCECGCGRQAVHVHHRKLRSQGGRHELSNLLHLAAACHDRAHANRDGVSYDLGLLVRSTDDPALVPVIVTEDEVA